MRYFIELSYDGSAYFGWQVQPGQTSVQEMLESAVKFKLRAETKITGCGRTDTGVHARQFFAHFDHTKNLTPEQLINLVYELNSFLPADIAVKRIFRVADKAHARFDAVSRTYKYYVNYLKNPFTKDYSWTLRINPDVDKMNLASAILLEYDDFTSFSKLHTDVKTNICRISEAFWEKSNGELVFTITADRFLRNMVRAIVGTLIDIGRNKIQPDNLHKIIDSKNRSNAGMSVPAKGLFLDKVTYDFDKISGF